MGLILIIIIVAILAITGLITFNIKTLSPAEKTVIKEDEPSSEFDSPSVAELDTELIVPADDDELKMKDQDYRLALSKLHKQTPNDEPAQEEKKPNVGKMKDSEYRGKLKNFQQKDD
ncbi:hypothetical protein [Peribacillus sp. SI8-4]|uniref:hypothetical protein n=1 Tax=Peribacillus sp. SI8-4 TaxID=3048009 RepID=UPI0025524E0C|nr:hypothetical protein [Peribacillus sp. SI8-4]